MNKKTTIISIVVILTLSIIFAVVASNFSKKEDVPEASSTESCTSATESSTENPSDVVTKPTEATPQFSTAPEGYFDNALFIGDSRTVGLAEYGGIDGATFFASVGMSVYKIEDERVSVANVGKITLAELLNQRQYDSIYIMLGINELGYNQSTTVKKFTTLIDSIRNKQPNATIYIEANIHVTKAMSDESDIYTNAKINEFNSAISKLADGKTIFYIDVNELFDDGQGNLDAKYTFDNTHLFGRYYKNWAEWLSDKVVIK